MTDVFDLLETQLCFPGVDSYLLSAKVLEHSSCIGEEVSVGFAVYEYIVDVYFAYSDNFPIINFPVIAVQALKSNMMSVGSNMKIKTLPPHLSYLRPFYLIKLLPLVTVVVHLY